MIQLDKKNKVMLILTMGAFSFLAWQLYDLLMPSSPVSHTVGTKQVVRAEIKKTLTRKAPQKITRLPKSNAPLPSTSQKRYLSLVEKIEYYKMQHQLLVQQLAVAKAKAQIAQLKLAGHRFVDDHSVVASPSPQGSQVKLSYLGKEGRQWVATVSDSGHFKTVSVGDHLQDGFTIIAMSDKGLTLSKGQLV